MALIMNAKAYRQILQEDMDWLMTVPRTLERDHIMHLLKWDLEQGEEVE